MPKIKVYRGRTHLFDKRLEEEDVIIGRSEEAGIPLDSPAASRRHIRLTRRQWNWYAEHLSDKNPALIEKRPFTTQKLVHGDTITIAEHTLVFEYPRSEQQQARGIAEGRAGAAFRLHAGDIEDALGDEDSGDRADAVRASAVSANATLAVDPSMLADLMAQQEKRRGAHLLLAQAGKRTEYPLERSPLVVGWSAGAGVKLPGSRWFGKEACTLVALPNGGHRIEPLSGWVKVLIGGEAVTESRPLYDSEVITLKHAFGLGKIKLRYQAAVLIGGARKRKAT